MMLLAGGGALLLAASEFGLGTLKSYRETKQNLLQGVSPSLEETINQEAGSSDEEIDPRNIGYCRMQGIYLAFKALGMLNTFHQTFPTQKLRNF